jgi:hypothetical protein
LDNKYAKVGGVAVFDEIRKEALKAVVKGIV